MKKFLIFIFCAAIIFLGCMFLATKTDALSGIASNLEMISLSFSKEDIVYDSNFMVNELGKIKYNTYYYDKLNDVEKKIYTSIACAVRDLNNEAVIKFDKDYDTSNASENIKNAMESFFADHPEVFYLNTEYQILTNTSLFGNMSKIYLGYSVNSIEQLNTEIKEIQNEIEKYSVNIKAEDSNYEKELKIHDSIAGSVSYHSYEAISDIPEIYHTAYGPVKDKSAVCDGFSKIFQLALLKNDIDSIIVTGTLDNDPHAWNMVSLDEEWYNVDLTSDKTIKEYSNPVIHAYFNITNEEIKNTHKFLNESLIPNATASKYNYYIKEGKYIDSNFNTQFEKILKINDNKNLVEFRVDSKFSSVPEKIVRRLSERDYLEYIDSNKNTIQYYNILNTYVIMKK